MLNLLLTTIAATAALQSGGPTSAQQLDRLLDLAKRRFATESPLVAAPDRSIKVAVDPRMELLTVIFRLAGNDEFLSDGLAPYAAYIDDYFKGCKDHPAVRYARRLRQERGVSCDAIFTLAIRLGPLPDLKEIAPLEDPYFKQRWRPEEARAFLTLVRKFAAESRFSEFFRKSAPLFRLTELRVRRLVHNDVDQKWFATYFGARPGAAFTIAPGLLNGAISYGVRATPMGSRQAMYAILGVWHFDKDGLPAFDADDSATVVHEFNHSFVNPILMKHESVLRPVGEATQKEVARSVQGMQGFEWRTLLEETIVRSVVARQIFARRGPKAADAEIKQQMGYGFIWIRDVFDLLARYEKSRKRYPSFESFLPQIQAYWKGLPSRLPKQLHTLDSLRPQVKTVEPVANAEDVDPSLDKITIVFDRPMRRGRSATVVGESGRDHFPAISSTTLDASGTILTLKVALKPDWSYELWLNSPLAPIFQSAEGIPLKPFRIQFRTRSNASARR